jgi:hypothetical protein
MNGDMKMNGIISRGRSLLALAGALLGVLALGAGAAGAAQTTVYNNIVSPLPGNFASVGFEATSTAEYGGQIELAGTARKHPVVTVAMSAWACQEGSTASSTCMTPKPNKKFKWSLTLNIYSVGAGNSVGTKLASVSHTFAMPYRPSQSAACATAGKPGAWLDAAAPGAETAEKCFHGMAFPVTFHTKATTPLPSKVIVSVAYDTSNYGEKPVGTTACNSTPAGCYYDSLNVSVIEPAEKGLTVGSDPTESQYVNSNWSEMYCGKTESLNTFAPSGVCAYYEGSQPAFEVKAS